MSLSVYLWNMSIILCAPRRARGRLMAQQRKQCDNKTDKKRSIFYFFCRLIHLGPWWWSRSQQWGAFLFFSFLVFLYANSGASTLAMMMKCIQIVGMKLVQTLIIYLKMSWYYYTEEFFLLLFFLSSFHSVCIAEFPNLKWLEPEREGEKTSRTKVLMDLVEQS